MGKIETAWQMSMGRRRALAGLAGMLGGSPLLGAQRDPNPLKDHRRIMGIDEMVTAFDFEPVFRANVTQVAYDTTAHGADSEFTMRRNREVFEWVDVVQRHGAGITSVDTSTEI